MDLELGVMVGTPAMTAVSPQCPLSVSLFLFYSVLMKAPRVQAATCCILGCMYAGSVQDMISSDRTFTVKGERNRDIQQQPALQEKQQSGICCLVHTFLMYSL